MSGPPPVSTPMHLFVYLLYQTTHGTLVPTTHRDHISPVPNIFVQGMKKLLVDLTVRGAIPFSLCLSICGDLSLLNMTPKDLYGQMHDTMVWLVWLATHRLIQNENNCAVAVK